MSYMIKDLPSDEKPREKALKKGISILSDSDLLAILLRSGTKNCSVKDLSLSVLQEVGGIQGLQDLRVNKLASIYGVGKVKAITILAAVELGKRLNLKEERVSVQIRESKDVYVNYSSVFEKEKQEKFFVLFLDSRNIVINEKVIFVGTANQSFIHPRDVFYEAILNNAVKIICIHNHPSGSVCPSLEDEKVTKKLVESGYLLNIPVIDHIIMGKENYYSFLEHGKVF